MASAGGYYAVVQRILNNMSPTVMSKFAVLDTDIKRVIFARKLDFVEDAFVVNPCPRDKSEQEARKFRESGNDLYKKKEYGRAQELYTKSVCLAPATPGDGAQDEEFSLALANRSATLFQLDNYRAALQDMLLSLQHGYPEELRFKLYDRMGKCFLKLGRPDDARFAFEKAQKYLPAAQLTDAKRESWMETITKSMDSCSLTANTNGEQSVYDIGTNEPPATRKPLSQTIPCASDVFDVHYEDDLGRFVVAKYPVKVGDVLVCELPFTSVLRKESANTHCYHCFRRLDVPIPCFGCSVAKFCSGLCRDTAWFKWHEMECPFLKEIHNSGVGNMGHIGLRVILETGLDKLLQRRVGERANNKILVNEKGEYVGEYEALLDLVGNSSQRNDNEMFQYTLLTVYMLTVLKASGFFRDEMLQDRKPHMVENYVAGILLRFFQITSCNGIEIMETAYSGNIQKASQTSLGLALYPTLALINHSCNPNMELIFYDNRCIARAIRNVPSGQELSIDYGYIYYLTDQLQRTFCLRSQYYFDCSCDACYNRWPVQKDLPAGIPTLKCLKCGYPLSITEQGGGSGDPTQAKCRKCGSHMTPLAYLEEYYESSKLFDKALDEIRRGNLETPCRILENHLCIMEKYLMLPVKEYVMCLSAIKQCYRVMGNNVKSRGSIY